jgi:GT2 family glycosyltransferase
MSCASSLRVSVIIVNYNGGTLLTECVQSVLLSTLPLWVYVVDNASVDHSFSNLKEQLPPDAPVTMIQNSENRGFAAAVNQVLSQVQTDYSVILNPDCLLQADTVQQFCAVLDQEEYRTYGMAGGLVRNPDGTEQAGCRRAIPSPWRALVRVLHLNRWFPQQSRFDNFVLTEHPLPNQPIAIEGISGACMVVRREAVAQVGLMDEQYFLHCEDLDWFMRFGEAGWPILFIPHINIVHIKGACSQREPLRVLWYKHRGMIRFYKKFFRRRYPLVLYWGVATAVWLRFGLLAVPLTLRTWLR